MAAPFVMDYIGSKSIKGINGDIFDFAKKDKRTSLNRTIFFTGIGVFGLGMLTTIIASASKTEFGEKTSICFCAYCFKRC